MRVEAVMVVWFSLRRFGRLDAIVGDSHLFCYTLRNYKTRVCATLNRIYCRVGSPRSGTLPLAETLDNFSQNPCQPPAICRQNLSYGRSAPC